MGGQP